MGQISKDLAALVARIRAKLLASQSAIRPTISATITPTTLNGAGTVTITATVTNATSVDVYRDGTKVTTLTSAPYTFSDPVSGGTGTRAYRLVARNTTQSAEATATLTLNIPLPDILPPVVVLTPSTLRVMAAGSVTLAATVIDLGGVASVKFYRGETLLGTRTNEPYTITDTLGYADNGEVIYTAVATDLAGNVGASVPVPVAVAIPDTVAPVVSLGASSTNITANGTLTLTAEATDAGGVDSVKFYRDTTLLATLTEPPYTVSESVTASANGTYLYKAVATDKAGNTSQATQSVTINITRTYPAGALARYTMDAGADTGLLYDSSGNGHTLTLGSGTGADGADPVYSAAGLHFDGTDDYIPLTLADVSADVLTLILQARPDADVTVNRRLLGIGYSGGPTFEVYREATQGILAVRVFSGTYLYPNFRDSWAAGQTLLIGVRWHRQTGQVFLSVGGQPWQEYQSTAAPVTGSVTSAYLGWGAALGGTAWKGDVGFLAIYNRALTDVEMADAYALTPAMASEAGGAMLTNDGDAFRLSWPAQAGATEYVVKRAYAAAGRQFVPVNTTTVTGTTYADFTVYDELHVWYQVCAVVGGVESVIAELDGVQPARVWTEWESVALLPSGTYTGLNIRMRTHQGYAGERKGAISLERRAKVIILSSRIASVQHAIHGFENEIVVRDTRMWALYPGGTGRAPGKAINAEGGKHLDVQFSFDEGFLTTEMKNYTGNFTLTNTYVAKHNVTRNVEGRKTDGKGGYQIPAGDGNDSTFVRAQAYLFNGIVDVPGVDIGFNHVHNEVEFSRVEDNINTFRSSGTAASKLRIHHNLIMGAYPATPFNPASTYYTGGGIIAGDVNSGHVLIEENLVGGCSNYSYGLVGGNDSNIPSGKAIRSPRAWNGKLLIPTNLNGLQYYDYNKAGASVFKSNNVSGLILGVQYESPSGQISTRSAYATAQNIAGANNTYTAGTVLPGPITYADEYALFAEHRAMLAAAGIPVIGPRLT